MDWTNGNTVYSCVIKTILWKLVLVSLLTSHDLILEYNNNNDNNIYLDPESK